MFETYTRIFTRLGLRFRPVEADTGAIGGSSSHEFMVLADTGEEQIAHCKSCGYAANIERAETKPSNNSAKEAEKPLQEVATPNLFRVNEVASHVGVGPDKVIKTIFLIADGKPVVALVRGDTDLNEHKLQRLLGAQQMRPAKDDEYRDIAGCEVGYAGPMKLKAKMVADHLIPHVVNGVSGANKKDTHLKNVNVNRDYKPDVIGDIRNIREGDECPRCGSAISFCRGIEVGHVFKLGTKYSEAMKAEFLDVGGKSHPLIMGCYGIGVSRIVAAAIEQNFDEGGIMWPVPIAPFEVLITPTNVTDEKSAQVSDRLYEDFQKKGVDVLLDDRDVRAGFKFKDADLIGIPLRVTVGEKSLAKGVVELKARTEAKVEEIGIEDVVAKVVLMLQTLRK